MSLVDTRFSPSEPVNLVILPVILNRMFILNVNIVLKTFPVISIW